MSAPETAAVPPAVEATRWIAAASLLALVAIELAMHLWLPPRPSAWVLLALPLCAPLAGVLKRQMYTYRWTALLVWIYFMEGVVRAREGLLPLLEVALSVLLFIACSLHVRLRLRNFKHERSDLPAA